jgi:hypothetical protein
MILVAGTTLAIAELASGDAQQSLAYALGSLAGAILSAALFLALFYGAYPLASDWITEWAGYVVGIATGAFGLALMAALLLSAAPVFLAFALPLVVAFGTGFAIAGRLAGMGAPTARPRTKARRLRRP